MLQKDGEAYVDELFFLKHKKGQRPRQDGLPLGHRAEKMTRKGELVPNRMAEKVQNLFKFRNFHDQMDFSPWQCIAITKAIFALSSHKQLYMTASI